MSARALAARVGRGAARVRPYAADLAIGLAAVAIAWVYAAAVLRHTRPFGLPLDDAYIYLTYAKQLGRGEPFTYYPGGGYSAGSTSVLWPMLLAPFWALGVRGHALVWVSFGLCAALYAATCIGCYRLVRAIAGATAGLVAAALVLAIAPFAWTALAGMEVAFASTLLVLMLILLQRAPREGPPTRALGVCLAAASLSRPEATILVVFVASVAVVDRLRARRLRAAAWWAAPLAAPLAWVIANRLLAGHFFPNTGVAKSHFYQPGFDWTFWWGAVTSQTGHMLRGLFWDGASPLVWPRLVGAGWIIGAVRVMLWARRERRLLAGALVVVSTFALIGAVIASSGAWSFHNYRYIAAAFPLLVVTAACALAPVAWPARLRLPARVPPAWARAGGAVGAAVLAALFWRSALPAVRSDIALFAQNAADLNRQVVTLGEHIHRRLPDASIMFHDAGAIAYYGDTRVYDMLGLVTNGQAQVANNGPGSRFEFLESLPPERRPTHFAYYPGWMGQGELFGEVLRRTPLAPPFSKRRLIGDHDMQLIAATWHRVHTAERPLDAIPGWRVVDRVDIADLASERAHGWRGALGRRRLGDPTARWSMFHREVRATGLALDGGRTIRGAAERFTIEVDPARPVRLLLRTGGQREYPPWHEAIVAPVTLEASTDAGTVRAAVPPPTGALVEIPLELPVPRAREVEVRVTATGRYRVFHWFVLQPD
jgi:4-amino-4-deoxy-L-arabinose transferase-like glycosyltransferase